MPVPNFNIPTEGMVNVDWDSYEDIDDKTTVNDKDGYRAYSYKFPATLLFKFVLTAYVSEGLFRDGGRTACATEINFSVDVPDQDVEVTYQRTFMGETEADDVTETLTVVLPLKKIKAGVVAYSGYTSDDGKLYGCLSVERYEAASNTLFFTHDC